MPVVVGAGDDGRQPWRDKLHALEVGIAAITKALAHAGIPTEGVTDLQPSFSVLEPA